jgi:hypothetical protein
MMKQNRASYQARAQAIASFCDSTTRTVLKRKDIRRYFPKLLRVGLPSGYYIETSSTSPILGLLRVDTHLRTVPRIVQQSQKLIARHSRDPPFRTLIARQQFRIAWLVPTEMKAVILNDAFHRASLACCEAVCVPCLFDAVMPLPEVVGL